MRYFSTLLPIGFICMYFQYSILGQILMVIGCIGTVFLAAHVREEHLKQELRDILKERFKK